MGVTVEEIKPGDGKTFAKPGQTVSVHYTGTLEDGTIFDSSHKRGKPFETKIGVGQVIKGWDEGFQKMSENGWIVRNYKEGALIQYTLLYGNRKLDYNVRLLTEAPIDAQNVIASITKAINEISLGGKARLTITSDYAYGSAGIRGVIPPNATLIFEVELLGIK